MSRLRSILAFVYDFVVGDDWRLALAVVLGLLVTWTLAARDLAAWWVMPVVVAAALGWSLWRARRAELR